ncbi:hypothetical protein EYF80_058189 [Liparis tanakae]|uniref:Uncharacterized protein n=1 Tax=Liparis tanakae TaxID=230148 RepID=A0A4Z2ETF1_9TELE|nr:hypothetical protein EYF80_058189 [Liparis tanakae]
MTAAVRSGEYESLSGRRVRSQPVSCRVEAASSLTLITHTGNEAWRPQLPLRHGDIVMERQTKGRARRLSGNKWL